MAFNVRFYTHGKEVNSTSIPSDAGTLVSCVANGRLDMATPSIKLQMGFGGGEDSPRRWNYCYIAPFNRYYFIQNWAYEGGLWYAECSVDVLGTYRSEIGELSPYIVRSAHSFDGRVSDAMYPALNQYTYGSATAASPWITNLATGTIVVGIAGSGSTYYYKFTYVNFALFINRLLSDNYASSVLTRLGMALNSEAKAICDPLQYITSVIFIPRQDTDARIPQTLQVGFGEVEATCAHIQTDSNVTNPSVTISGIPTHPEATERGEYLNHSPWSRYVLDIPPFGSVELDPDKFRGSVTANFSVDWCTGNAVMRVIGSSGAEISLLKGCVGVPIQIGQVVARGTGLLSITQSLASIAGNALSGNLGAAFGGVVGGIKDVINNQVPTLHSTGSLGSWADLHGAPTVYAKFTHPVPESRATRGRPLCKAAKISTLPGYLVCADPDISGMEATAREKDSIYSYLTGGFYYA